MAAGAEIATPMGAWQTLIALLAATGLGGVLTALIQRPSRANADASAAKDHSLGGSAVITATAGAFVEVTSGLREEIERLQQDVGRVQSDLAAAHARAVELEARCAELSSELERERSEKTAALAKADAAQQKIEHLNGEVRQLQQLLASKAKVEGKT